MAAKMVITSSDLSTVIMSQPARSEARARTRPDSQVPPRPQSQPQPQCSPPPYSHTSAPSDLSRAAVAVDTPLGTAPALNNNPTPTPASDTKMSQSQPPSQQPLSQQSLSLSQPSSQQHRSLPDSQSRLGNSQGLDQGHGPQIYSAVYSSIDVYEMEVNGIAVMRRRQDSWLNATQILKVAGVDKGKRTKILEREIQTGEHEKVQGGYGKYQGTWIKFERGLEVCRQYGVDDILRPLLTYDMGQDGGVAGQGDFNTPTKEQAQAAQRKRMYSNAHNESRMSSTSGPFFKSISSTASTAVAAINKARYSPGPRGHNGPRSRPPSFSRQSSSIQNVDDLPGNSQQSFGTDHGQHTESAFSIQKSHTALKTTEPPRKKQRVMSSADSFGYPAPSMDMYARDCPGSPTEPNESFREEQTHGEEGVGLPPLRYDMSVNTDARSVLMSLFLHAEPVCDFTADEAFQSLSPVDLDSPVDSANHTALHWAASLARLPLLRALILAGASPFRVNSMGETALMRACSVTNNSDQSSFPELLDLLGDTIEVRDNRGRTVLHHIALSSGVKGRSHSSHYYLVSLLEWVVRQGSAPNSQNSTGRSLEINLGRFMGEMVNAQDKGGDTALNAAARIGHHSIISQLLEVGADPNIANRSGVRPVDFGVGHAGEDSANRNTADRNGDGDADNSQRSWESSDDVIASITNMLHETSASFQSELKQKQTDLDSLHTSLRTTASEFVEAKRRLESLQAAGKSQALTRQKIFNLSRGREEEQARLQELEQSRGPLDASASDWEGELMKPTALENPDHLPSSTVLRARVTALRQSTDSVRKAVSGLQCMSQDVELKYRRVVSLCTHTPEDAVEVVIDGLLRAVESEKEGLDIGRVRRFLGGVHDSS